jgi:hypothetical protein
VARLRRVLSFSIRVSIHASTTAVSNAPQAHVYPRGGGSLFAEVSREQSRSFLSQQFVLRGPFPWPPSRRLSTLSIYHVPEPARESPYPVCYRFISREECAERMADSIRCASKIAGRTTTHADLGMG